MLTIFEIQGEIHRWHVVGRTRSVGQPGFQKFEGERRRRARRIGVFRQYRGEKDSEYLVVLLAFWVSTNRLACQQTMEFSRFHLGFFGGNFQIGKKPVKVVLVAVAASKFKGFAIVRSHVIKIPGHRALKKWKKECFQSVKRPYSFFWNVCLIFSGRRASHLKTASQRLSLYKSKNGDL